ncbi:molybdopterin biosynthesis protein MoeB [Polynucleobacter wuianus]|uniref:Molybdopterin-synthase adenylyltransferase n=1 Tax=Polynucleobacter wuianus TaxID=1743168 RepID=A0A191UI04_9BURK|nr:MULTISPECIES: HesA/MoeB/ThiF family protein [Polynucleobacter]ANJ00532.1 molybdopterin biosynthesis protein MoeB [Polynucleobacter wuianus]MBU3553123.1 HesA/MoeB/ThiF family protein [Polynucleobacter sp. MWH-Post4-6-1]MBU3609800.1 HesA/MoeB/ThiF family protein [Polynucleobacter wuianus]
MNDAQLLRYSRHLLLEDIDVEGQEKLLNAHALVIGAGGLGSAAAPYLAAAGVGHITLVDHDEVELTNLQRQIMHTESTIGESKVASGKQFLQQLNSSIQIEIIQSKATEALLDELLPSVDIVLDCTDNFSTRQLINASCVKHQIPLVSGSALRFDGQVSVFDSRNATSPCYACIFSPDEEFEEVSCASMGIFSPLVGIIGAIQAAQALQVLIAFGEPLIGRMLLWNARTTQIDQIRIARNHDCLVCGKSR